MNYSTSASPSPVYPIAPQPIPKGAWVLPQPSAIDPAAAARAWFWLSLWTASPPAQAAPTLTRGQGTLPAGTTTTPQIEWINGVAYAFRWGPSLGSGSPPWPAVQVAQWVPAIAPGVSPIYGMTPGVSPMYPGL